MHVYILALFLYTWATQKTRNESKEWVWENEHNHNDEWQTSEDFLVDSAYPPF